MTDTAQPTMAAENVALDEAAAAFKASFAPPPLEKPRDERGRFAPAESPQDEEIEADPHSDDGVTDEAESPEDQAETDEAADEAQPDPVPLPDGWSKEDEALWQTLPADAQAKLAEREAERNRAVNLKFQEAANIRKANEGLIREAEASRTQYAEAIEQVLSLVKPQAPTPYEYGYGTPHYDAAAYDVAKYQYEQQLGVVNSLSQQRQQIAAQQEQAERARLSEIEAQTRPAFLEAVPELNDPAKAPVVLNELVQYGVKMGIPEDTFAPDNAWRITAAELHVLWKAQQFDKMMQAKGRVVETKPEPRKPQPAVKPGAKTPASAIAQAKTRGAFERLEKEGSVEAGAAVLKSLFKGR